MSQASTAVDAVDVDLFPLFLLCQMASLYLFFSISAPGIAPPLPFPKKCLHLAECGIADLWVLIIIILDKQPLPAQGADLPGWAPLPGGGVSGAGLGIPPGNLPWDRGAMYLCCVKHPMSTGDRKNQRETDLDPWVLQNECLAAEGILILTVSLGWMCLHGGA